MILVTGATGTIGSELSKLLSSKGIKFRAYVRSVKKAEALKLVNMEIFNGDLSDKVALKKGMRGMSRVFLLSSADPRQVEYQRNVIEAAKAEGVKLIVKLSAYGAAAKSPRSLARWHWETEEELRKSGVPYAILRPTMFMQNLLMSAESVKKEGVIRSPIGEAKASFIDARDIAKCAATILTGRGFEGKVYELTGPRAITYRDIAKELTKVGGHEVKVVNVSLEDARRSVIGMGVPEWLANDITKLNEIFAAGQASFVTTSVRDVTGVTARGVETFVEDYAEAFFGAPVHH
ncbi:MAG: SDR family oxidoreductase [Nitrospinae bacterium]|nr:SDR family oxidoreductase [Nitrospinota bacterium]